MRGYRENSHGEIVKNVSKPSGEFYVCMVAMTVVTVGWDYQGAAEPPAVIVISASGSPYHSSGFQ
jgi:hypothetical protein